MVGNRTQGCWVISKNATSVPCRPHADNVFIGWGSGFDSLRITWLGPLVVSKSTFCQTVQVRIPFERKIHTPLQDSEEVSVNGNWIMSSFRTEFFKNGKCQTTFSKNSDSEVENAKYYRLVDIFRDWICGPPALLPHRAAQSIKTICTHLHREIGFFHISSFVALNNPIYVGSRE